MTLLFNGHPIGKICEPEIDNYHLIGRWVPEAGLIYDKFLEELQESGQVSIEIEASKLRGTIDLEANESLDSEIEINLSKQASH